MPSYKLKTLVLLSLLPLLLTACTLQDLPGIGKFFGGNETSPIELAMWGLWEKDYTFQPIVETYKETYPNFSLNYEDMSVLNLDGLVEYKKRVFSRLEQDSWDVDVVMVHNSWVPRLAAAGYLDAMPSDLIDAETYAQKFYPVASTDSVFGGNVFAVPAYYDGLVLVYNKDHFEEVGQVSAPTAWEEFRRLAIDLTVLEEGSEGQITRAGAAVGSADNIAHFSDILGLMWAQTGVRIPQQIDSVPAQDAMDFYLDLMREYKVWRSDFPEATTAFVNGQVSMIFVPSWQILDIIAANPTLNFGVAVPPQANPEAPITWGSYWSYVVPKNADDKKDAWNYIDYMSSEEAQLAMHQEASSVRPFGTAFSLTSIASELDLDPYLAPVLDTAPYARSAEIAGRSGNRLQETELAKAINSILDDDLDMTVADALTEAKKVLAPGQ
jgi:ABC-type glycerol-3-phosphate transport system substrate-binding protein